jgi:hypothetical protein
VRVYLLSLNNLYIYIVYSYIKRNLRDVSKLNTLIYNKSIFYITVVPDIYSLGQCIIIFIFLFESLKRLKLIFILLSSVFYILLFILFDSIIYNERLYDKETTGANSQLKELRTLI